MDNATYSENHQYWFRDPASTYVETQAQCDALGTGDFDLRELRIYPNPVANRFYIVGQGISQPKKVVLYDILGNRVKTFPPNTQAYDVSNLQKGLYFVEIESRGKSLVRKILKE